MDNYCFFFPKMLGGDVNKLKKKTGHGIPFELKGEIITLMTEQMPNVG